MFRRDLAWRVKAPLAACLPLGLLLLGACASNLPPETASRGAQAPLTPADWFERSWLDEQGKAVKLSTWRGTPLVLTMVYRTCRSRCPMTIHKLQRVERAFRAHGRNANFVLVTLDPLGDTPPQLAAFKKEQGFDSWWHLLGGELNQTRALARFLRVRPAYDDNHIDHEVRTAVFDAQGRLVENIAGWAFDDNEPVIATRQE